MRAKEFHVVMPPDKRFVDLLAAERWYAIARGVSLWTRGNIPIW
jgi:hypothetical protein